MDNWYEWQTYVNDKIGEFQNYMEQKERDNEMYVIRLQRSLDAALQTIGELQSQLQPPYAKDTKTEQSVGLSDPTYVSNDNSGKH